MSLTHFILLVALLGPLSIDVFILSTVLGLSGLEKKDRLRTSLVLTAFEAGMPIIGVLIGHGVGSLLGKFAGYIAVIAIGLAGLLMVKPS
jgi:putative Mn2+ efflux pump MntP